MSIKTKILDSIVPILGQSQFVSLDESQLHPLAQKLRAVDLPSWDNDLQLKADLQQTVQYYFFLDSTNFCFWPPKGQQKWRTEHKGEWLSGYYAYSYAIKQAFLKETHFSQADYLATISFDDFKAIFAGQGELQLLNERWQIIQENFQILREKYSGQALSLVEAAHGDASQLVELLLRDFPSFRDLVIFDGQPVYFLKRAQIFPSDIAFGMGKSDQLVTNLQDLAVFADYKLPQILQANGVLIYNKQLLEWINNEDLISSGSQAEIEIRSWTIQACDLLVKELVALGRTITNQELDWLLWVLAKQTDFALGHHRTVTTAY